MSEPENRPEWVALAAEVNRNAQCWNCNEEDGCDCMRAVLAAVAPLIRADERERSAKVAKLTARYYEDGQRIASAIRGDQPG